MIISPSSAAKLRQCEFKWVCNSVLRIEPKIRSASPAMDRGTLMHALLEVALKRYAASGEVFAFDGDEGVKVMKETFSDVYKRKRADCSEEDAQELLEAMRYHIPKLGLEQWEILTIDGKPCVEIELEARWGHHTIGTIVDLVFKHRTTGKIWHVNWKTSRDNIPATTHVTNDYQLLIERLALEANGITPDISALCKIRSRPPAPPHLVRNGTKASCDKSKVACDWETYAATVRGLVFGDPDDEYYDGMREHLANVRFIRWMPNVMTEASEAKALAGLDDLLNQATRLRQSTIEAVTLNQPLPEPRRLLGYNCKGCEYRMWCDASLNAPDGLPLDLLGTEYKVRDDRSPLRGLERYDVPVHDPSELYVKWAQQQGQQLEPHQEFKP